MNTEWISKFTGPREARAICHQCYRINVDTTSWVFATNGHVMLAMEAALGDFSFAPCCQSVITSWLKKELGDRITTVANLRAWAGPDTFEYCTHCDENELDVNGECLHCEGYGYIDFEYRNGRINDVLINRYLIAKAFWHLPDGPVHVVTDGPESAVFFIGSGWRVVVMPMRYASGPIEVVEFSAWDNVA